MNVIKLPFTENETKESVTQFEKAHVILQCLGAIDGTHNKNQTTRNNYNRL